MQPPALQRDLSAPTRRIDVSVPVPGATTSAPASVYDNPKILRRSVTSMDSHGVAERNAELRAPRLSFSSSMGFAQITSQTSASPNVQSLEAVSSEDDVHDMQLLCNHVSGDLDSLPPSATSLPHLQGDDGMPYAAVLPSYPGSTMGPPGTIPAGTIPSDALPTNDGPGQPLPELPAEALPAIQEERKEVEALPQWKEGDEVMVKGLGLSDARYNGFRGKIQGESGGLWKVLLACGQVLNVHDGQLHDKDTPFMEERRVLEDSPEKYGDKSVKHKVVKSKKEKKKETFFLFNGLLLAGCLILLMDAWYLGHVRQFGPHAGVAALAGLFLLVLFVVAFWSSHPEEVPPDSNIFQQAADDINWNMCLTVLIGSSGVEVGPPQGKGDEGGGGAGHDMDDMMASMGMGRRQARMMGMVGGGPPSPKKGDEGGGGGSKVITKELSQALLEYGNKYWKSREKAPSGTISVEVIDRGKSETMDSDGKVSVKLLKDPVFVPVGLATDMPQDVREKREQRDLEEESDESGGVWSWFQGAAYKKKRKGPKTEYAPLTPSGDIQLAFKAQASLQNAKREAKKKKEAEKKLKKKSSTAVPTTIRRRVRHSPKEDDDSDNDSTKADKDEDSDGEDDSNQPIQADCWLVVYGEDGWTKVQKLISTVLGTGETVPKEEPDEENKTLYWYEFDQWQGGQPQFKRKAVPGTRQEQRNYHYAFFHPDKERLLGTHHSLLDQFTEKTGNFSIQGAPEKLNFLFYGPPGTGKSMFAKVMAMYMGRHVVSFKLSAINTNRDLHELLDNLNNIPPPPPGGLSEVEQMLMMDRGGGGMLQAMSEPLKYKDIIFVIEEIDTDERGICDQRKTKEDGTYEENTKDDDDDEDGDESPGSPPMMARTSSGFMPPMGMSSMPPMDMMGGMGMPGMGGMGGMGMPGMPGMDGRGGGKKGKKKKDKQNAKLELGTILTVLQGGAEAPGRIIVMTSNRAEQLDEALKRPGRLKKVYMDNLQFPGFKKIIMHFRQNGELGVPTVSLWTVEISRLAHFVFEDFQTLEKQRKGDLDKRGIGLSPALLVEMCMDSHSLEDLFNLLVKEAQNQWKKTNLPDQPASKYLVENFEWRKNTIRQTVLYHIGEGVEKAGKQRAVHMKDVERAWPETPLPALPGSEEKPGSHREGAIVQAMDAVLDDERKLNQAFEKCTYDYAMLHAEFKYKLEVELALARAENKPENGYDFNACFKVLTLELKHRWKHAWQLNDVELQGQLGSPKPPSLEQVSAAARSVRGS